MASYTKQKRSEILSSILILLFVYTAVSKLLTIHQFLTVVDQYPLIGKFGGWAACALPVSELITAALLWFSKTRMKGFAVSLLLLISFTLYIGYMLIFYSKLPCSCGGIISSLSWNQHVLLNIALIAIAFYGFMLERQYHTSAYIMSQQQSQSSNFLFE